jgi:PBP1b-binding outer membrane lipoprotein LpoB
MKFTTIVLVAFSILIAVIFSGCTEPSKQTNTTTNITENITKNVTTTLNETKNTTQIQVSLPTDAPFTTYNIAKSKSKGAGLPPEPPE